MIEESHIIKNGGKRIRHGSYKIVYRDYHVKNKREWFDTTTAPRYRQ